MPLDPKTKYALASKPILWSGNGYRGPSDPKVYGGFVQESGYGGEEWNGDSRRVRNGFRYFSSQSEAKLDDYATYGHLGLIMTAVRDGIQYIVGVACDVSLVTDEEGKALRKAFKLHQVGKDLWGRPLVRKKFSSEAEFKSHWGTGLQTIHWKCPASLYHWFDQPLALPEYPLRPDRKVLSKMHGSYQRLRPEDGILLLGQALPATHEIFRWLVESDFDPLFPSAEDRKNRPPLSRKERAEIASAAAAKKPYTRYLMEREITINAQHGLLEADFENYLASIGAENIKPNINGIDVSFRLPGSGDFIAELKPAAKDETRFALRIAVGQILEYRHFKRPDARPLIVLGSKPKPSEIEFAKALGISCAWRSGKTFEAAWTNA